MTTNLIAWIERGRELNCFASDQDQLAYWQAWDALDAETVRFHLRAVFTSRYRMPALNWLGHENEMNFLDQVEDGPVFLPEEWAPANFFARTPSGIDLGPEWFLAAGGTVRAEALAEYTLEQLRAFLSLPLALKVSALRTWQSQIEACAQQLKQSFDGLLSAFVKARLLAEFYATSASIRTLSPELARVVDFLPLLEERLRRLGQAWWFVLGRPKGSARLLTLHALESAEDTIGLRDLLVDTQGPRTANLLSYLRCETV